MMKMKKKTKKKTTMMTTTSPFLLIFQFYDLKRRGNHFSGNIHTHIHTHIYTLMVPAKEHADGNSIDSKDDNDNDNDGEEEKKKKKRKDHNVIYIEDHEPSGKPTTTRRAAVVLRLVFAICIVLLGARETQMLGTNFSPSLSSLSDFRSVNEDGVHYYGLDSFSWHTNLSRAITSERCEFMDVVFTWANGTDPQYVREWEKAARKKMDDYGKLRSTDHGTLRFAVRSVVTHVPFVRNIILVTNNQVPTWAREDDPRFRILSTDEVFANKSHLPSFNSNSIEANLHNIPGLSECFLYSCDDFFMARDVTMNDFITEDGRSILCK